MGVKAAFSTWATASLEAVEVGDLAPDAANDLLAEVEDAPSTDDLVRRVANARL